MSYDLVRKLLFKMPAETAHDVSLKALQCAHLAGILPLFVAPVLTNPVEIFGMTFPNRVGLAAGLDKNGDYIDALARLGFGFIEVGTVTPRPQPGNPQPRMFRLTEHEAVINRMGFNNKGVDYLVERLRRMKYKGILGINVGKNKDTPANSSDQDYRTCIEKVYEYASYITINVSSPNTPGLRSLQFGDSLTSLLAPIMHCQNSLQKKYHRRVPFILKIAPDMSDEEIRLVAQTLLEYQLDGVIATNTTLSRVGIEGSEYIKEQGGLSGKPLKDRSTHVINALGEALKGQIPVIASGGIMTADDAMEKFKAGANLVQLYSGLVYRGPGLIREAVEKLSEY